LERKRKKGAKERDLVQGCRTYSDNRKTEYKDSTLKSDLMRSERERAVIQARSESDFKKIKVQISLIKEVSLSKEKRSKEFANKAIRI
jgi:hypothetical protein